MSDSNAEIIVKELEGIKKELEAVKDLANIVKALESKVRLMDIKLRLYKRLLSKALASKASTSSVPAHKHTALLARSYVSRRLALEKKLAEVRSRLEARKAELAKIDAKKAEDIRKRIEEIKKKAASKADTPAPGTATEVKNANVPESIIKDILMGKTSAVEVEKKLRGGKQ